MAQSETNDERVSVRTYVPAYQRSEWDEHADELGMSRSEYVRTMVQAGRSGFLDADETEQSVEATGGSTSADVGSQSGAGELEDQVIRALSAEAYLSWDELLAAVTDEIEAQLEETLQELQSNGQVQYSGRNGGYTLDE